MRVVTAPSLLRHLNRAAYSIVSIGALAEFWHQRWFAGLACIGVLVLMSAPLLVRRSSSLPLSYNTCVLISLLLLSWLFLGELHGYFERLAWWDLFLHGFAGAVIALVGVRIASAMVAPANTPQRARYAFAAVFGFSLAMAVGALWEILEFIIDRLFALGLLKPMFGDPSGLTDTFFDLIADAVGAFFASIYGLVRLHRIENAPL